jgi:hypothetical protein
MFDVPINSTLSCKGYFNSPQLNLPPFLITFAVSICLENLEKGKGLGFGIDLFITSVANEYFAKASQVITRNLTGKFLFCNVIYSFVFVADHGDLR